MIILVGFICFVVCGGVHLCFLAVAAKCDEADILKVQTCIRGGTFSCVVYFFLDDDVFSAFPGNKSASVYQTLSHDKS